MFLSLVQVRLTIVCVPIENLRNLQGIPVLKIFLRIRLHGSNVVCSLHQVRHKKHLSNECFLNNLTLIFMYNGWSNYETWRIALEVFDGYQVPEEIATEGDDCVIEHLKEVVDLVIFEGIKEDSLANGLLVSFISEVNFYEIAEHLTENA